MLSFCKNHREIILKEGSIPNRAPKEIRDTFPCNYKWRFFNETDANFICTWIKSKDSLNLVSSYHGNKLTEKILSCWVQKSLFSVVATESERNEPIGFFTISSKEACHLPLTAVELCHLIIKPRRDYFLLGNFLCSVAKKIAKWLGFYILVGRVVPKNEFGISLAISQDFKRIQAWEKLTISEFLWFAFELTEARYILNEEIYGKSKIQYQAQSCRVIS